jgi:4-hydroxy-4-methyl-2-oxoglutarate aldolase
MSTSGAVPFDRLHTALLCDVLDRLGHTESFVGPHVRPIAPGMRVAGRAFTLRAEPVDRRPERPYAQLLAAFGHLQAGDVVVVAAGGQLHCGLWGELLSIAAQARGAVGAITDGLVRDVEQIAEIGFPVFAAGASPLDSDGRQEVVEFGGPVSLGGTTVRPGDLVVADAMGAITVPAQLADEAVGLALDKASGESTVRDELAAGAEIGAVFARHGIL